MSLHRLLCGALLALVSLAALPRPALSSAPLDSLLSRPTLDRAFFERAVLDRNPSLGAMRAAWRGAEAQADRAGAWDQPMIEIMAAPESFGSNAVDPGYAGSISQRLPLSGRKGIQGRAARAGARAAEEDLRAARLDLLRDSRRAYYEYYLIGRRQAINAELQDLMAQFRRIAVGKYSAGTVGLSDALQADVELAMLDHEKVALARERRVVTARMNALLLRDPGPLPAPPESIALPAVPARPDSLRTFAVAVRPELRSWTEQRRAKEAELSLARRYRLPDVTLTARYDRFMEEREWRGQVGAGLELPIFGGYGGAAREARAGIEQMEQRRRAAEAQIGLELESALAGAQETEHEMHIIRERVVPATERALAAIRASYENNRADFLALLNAERDLARARLDLYRAEAMYLQNMADLDRALGADPGEVTR